MIYCSIFQLLIISTFFATLYFKQKKPKEIREESTFQYHAFEDYELI